MCNSFSAIDKKKSFSKENFIVQFMVQKGSKKIGHLHVNFFFIKGGSEKFNFQN